MSTLLRYHLVPNVAGAVFPSSIVAAAFNFLPMEFFELGGPGEAPPVTFSLS